MLQVGDDAYTVQLDDGKVHVEAGAAEVADLDFETDQATFFAMASGQFEPRSALADGRVTISTGKPAALERFFSVFNYAPRAQVAV